MASAPSRTIELKSKPTVVNSALTLTASTIALAPTTSIEFFGTSSFAATPLKLAENLSACRFYAVPVRKNDLNNDTGLWRSFSYKATPSAAMTVVMFEQHKGCPVTGFDTGTHVEIDRHGYLKVRGNTTEHFLHMQRHKTIEKKQGVLP